MAKITCNLYKNNSDLKVETPHHIRVNQIKPSKAYTDYNRFDHILVLIIYCSQTNR